MCEFDREEGGDYAMKRGISFPSFLASLFLVRAIHSLCMMFFSGAHGIVEEDKCYDTAYDSE